MHRYCMDVTVVSHNPLPWRSLADILCSMLPHDCRIIAINDRDLLYIGWHDEQWPLFTDRRYSRAVVSLWDFARRQCFTSSLPYLYRPKACTVGCGLWVFNTALFDLIDLMRHARILTSSFYAMVVNAWDWKLIIRHFGGYYDVEAFSRPYDLNSLCDLIPMDSSFIPQNE